jgi:hypothetical protein
LAMVFKLVAAPEPVSNAACWSSAGTGWRKAGIRRAGRTPNARRAA